MKVEIIRTVDNQAVDAEINGPGGLLLPSVADGWRFNFKKHAKKKGFQTYVLTCVETPDSIEGCLIFQMRGKVEPYMAFIEIAPYNKGKNRKYDNVAGCLIAYGCRLSFIHGEGPYLGWLCFDVLEENKADERKLMAMYCKKYGALKFGETTMVISPEAGEQLINEFLK